MCVIIASMNDKLTPQQLLFCKYYTTKGDTFGNNTLSYALAYEYDIPTKEDGTFDVLSQEYKTCKSNGSRLYYNDDVRGQIRGNLLAMLNNDTVDERMTDIIISGKDADSIQAIKIHNDLKQRITKKLDITTQGRPLSGLSDDELQALAG